MRVLLATVVLLCAACFANAGAAKDGADKPAVHKAPPALLLGTAWYPESWPESRWEADLSLMQAAHIRYVRVGEFAWSRMERTEGNYDFDWLERAINLAARHDIYVVLGTPTAAPPAWLTQKYPETLRTEDNGQKDVHGGRLQYNWDNAKYRELCRDIAERMAKRFGHNPNVLGWQIDNEYSSISFDPQTRADFDAWLHSKYKTLDNLNTRWTTDYWSQYYTDWSQIPIPDHDGHEGGNPGLLLNWREFVTDTFRSYQKNQVDVIRANSDGRQFITTNTMGWFDLYDAYTTEQDLDMAAWDDYFGDGKADLNWSGSTHDLTRGFKRKNFWVMETQPGFVNWAKENVSLPAGVVRALAWHDIGHGADSVSYWQWRSALNGQEQYHGTLVGADGTPVPLYAEVQQEGAEFERAAPVLKDTQPKAEVAILHSYPSYWAINWQRHTDKFDPIAELVNYYRPLRALTQSLDIVPPTAPLAGYKLVVAPALNLITQQDAANLIAYVKGGGNLVLGARSGMKDEDNALQPDRQPGPLEELLGGRVEQYYVLPEPISLTGDIPVKQATVWAELLSTRSPDTKVVLRYGKANGWLDGKPAMITRKVGKGSITYIGTCMGWNDMSVLATWMQQQFGFTTPLPGVPEGVEASRRYGAGHTVTILVNMSGKPQQIALPSAMDDVLQGGTVKQVQLPEYGVAVLNQKTGSKD
jgi:beta-galactosidase